MHIPILRWGEPYESLDVDPLTHFETGETIGEVSWANSGLLVRDMRQASRARASLRAMSVSEICRRLGEAAHAYMHAEVDGVGPARFMQLQAATTGLPEHLCRLNMEKLHHVLTNLEAIIGSLTRGLPHEALSDGRAVEDGIVRSFQATTPVLGLVLPSNSPGTHGLWLPVLALQVGLILKPGSAEPWTPMRLAQAFFDAGIPREAIGVYHGRHDLGQAVVDHVDRSIIFGGESTVAQHRGNPKVQVHGPGRSKILLGDDMADDWESALDLMERSVLANAGRSCINCSSIWTPRHGREIAEALAARLAPIAPRPVDDPSASLAAFTNVEQARMIDRAIASSVQAPDVTDVTATHRKGDRFIESARCAYLRPTVLHTTDPTSPVATAEYMFPFVTVVDCPQKEMLDHIGPTLIGTVLSDDGDFRRACMDSSSIDRLNLGPIETVRLDWMQPHEGNLIDFLYRDRALQIA